ncbi:DNA-directed RNA polymerase II 13.6 kDa polypeptide [Blastocladiella britannica]|nr:DNA-directed RNA polymerase II 13.6 kDa polypeptide [Blastocladiella britannica]
MNAPDRNDILHLPFGAKKVTITEDTRLPNAVEIKIEREDHTLGGMLKEMLLRDEDVLFAGYKHPHPLEYHIVLKLQTSTHIKPIDALKRSIERLILELATLKERFMAEVARVKTAKNLDQYAMDADD